MLRGKTLINHQILGTPFSEIHISHGVNARTSILTQWSMVLSKKIISKMNEVIFMLLVKDYNRCCLGMPWVGYLWFLSPLKNRGPVLALGPDPLESSSKSPPSPQFPYMCAKIWQCDYRWVTSLGYWRMPLISSLTPKWIGWILSCFAPMAPEADEISHHMIEAERIEGAQAFINRRSLWRSHA